MSAIIDSVAKQLGVSKERAEALVRELVDQVRTGTAHGDSVRLPGLGIFRVSGDRLQFEPESRLSAVVNHRFAGLFPIPVDAIGAPATGRPDSFAAANIPIADHDEEDESIAEYESEESSWPGSHVGIPVAGMFGASDVTESEELPGALADADATEERHEHLSPAEPERTEVDRGDDGEDMTQGAPLHDLPLSEPWVTGDVNKRFSSYDEGQDWSDDTGADLVPEDDILFGSSGVAGGGAALTDESERLEPEELASLSDEEEPEAVAEAVDTEKAGVVSEAEADSVEFPSEPNVVKVKSRRSGLYALIIVALLLAISAVLYLLSRGDGSSASSQAAGPESQPADTVETTPPAEVAETPTVPEWTPGTIDRSLDGYTIVTSSHSSLGEAEVYARELARAFADTDLPVDILQGTAQGRRWYRVAVGQYPRQSVVTRELRRLSDKLPEGSWVLRIRSNM